MCHPLAGGKGGTQYQGGKRDLRFERADYQTSDNQTSDRHCVWKRIPHLWLDTWCGEISRLRFATLEMTLGSLADCYPLSAFRGRGGNQTVRLEEEI